MNIKPGLNVYLAKSPKIKPPTVAKLKRQADMWFSQYVRLRDSDEDGMVVCITCPIRKPWKFMQAGHFVSRAVNILRYNEENVSGQCSTCNVLKSGNQYEYGKQLDLKYGTGTADKLHAQRWTTHRFTREELQQVIDEAKTGIAFKLGKQ